MPNGAVRGVGKKGSAARERASNVGGGNSSRSAIRRGRRERGSEKKKEGFNVGVFKSPGPEKEKGRGPTPDSWGKYWSRGGGLGGKATGGKNGKKWRGGHAD